MTKKKRSEMDRPQCFSMVWGWRVAEMCSHNWVHTIKWLFCPETMSLLVCHQRALTGCCLGIFLNLFFNQALFFSFPFSSSLPSLFAFFTLGRTALIQHLLNA